jgi:DNA-binding transcriptional ArsR family regulator
MSAPTLLLKAEFFKTLGHPVRIRVLELLGQREYEVSELLPEVGVVASNLSRQLTVLRIAGLVMTRREGSAAFCTLTTPRTAELLAVLNALLSEQMDSLSDLQARMSRGGGN